MEKGKPYRVITRSKFEVYLGLIVIRVSVGQPSGAGGKKRVKLG